MYPIVINNDHISACQLPDLSTRPQENSLSLQIWWPKIKEWDFKLWWPHRMSWVPQPACLLPFRKSLKSARVHIHRPQNYILGLMNGMNSWVRIIFSAQSCPVFCDHMDCSLPNFCPWGFSRQESWSGLPCPPSEELPNPGIEPRSAALQADSLPAEP